MDKGVLPFNSFNSNVTSFAKARVLQYNVTETLSNNWNRSISRVSFMSLRAALIYTPGCNRLQPNGFFWPLIPISLSQKVNIPPKYPAEKCLRGGISIFGVLSCLWPRGLEFCSLHVWIQWVISSLEQKCCLCLHSLWHSRVPFSAGLPWNSVRGMNHIKGESEWFWVTDTRV